MTTTYREAWDRGTRELTTTNDTFPGRKRFVACAAVLACVVGSPVVAKQFPDGWGFHALGVGTRAQPVKRPTSSSSKAAEVKAKTTLSSYFSALNGHHLGTGWSMLSPSYQESHTRPDYNKWWKSAHKVGTWPGYSATLAGISSREVRLLIPLKYNIAKHNHYEYVYWTFDRVTHKITSDEAGGTCQANHLSACRPFSDLKPLH